MLQIIPGGVLTTIRSVSNYLMNNERDYSPERNACYNSEELVQRLERAKTGEYKGYYDIDFHDKACIYTDESPFNIGANFWIPYLLPDNTRLTLEDGTPIEVKLNDWLVPFLIRKELKENIHLLLPSNLIGGLKAGDTLKLRYNDQVFTISITDDDPQYHDYQDGRYRGKFHENVCKTEHSLYQDTGLTLPSRLRKREGMKAHLGEIQGLIQTINANPHSTFAYRFENRKFQHVDVSKTYSLGNDGVIDPTTLEIRGPNIDSEFDVKPSVNKNGFGLYCQVSEGVQLIMTVAQNKLIVWRHVKPLNESHPTIPKEVIDNFGKVTDEFTVLPLNENTISADTVIRNVDKIKFVSDAAMILKV